MSCEEVTVTQRRECGVVGLVFSSALCLFIAVICTIGGPLLLCFAISAHKSQLFMMIRACSLVNSLASFTVSSVVQFHSRLCKFNLHSN